MNPVRSTTAEGRNTTAAKKNRERSIRKILLRRKNTTKSTKSTSPQETEEAEAGVETEEAEVETGALAGADRGVIFDRVHFLSASFRSARTRTPETCHTITMTKALSTPGTLFMKANKDVCCFGLFLHHK
jgi:hypothetical protein